MKIGIDARLIEETGVGRYIRNLVSELGTLDLKNRYILFLRKKSFNALKLPNSRWEKRLAEVPWHSVAEQFLMPWYFVREHLDLLHVPYFNVPLFYPGKLIVTIHDLTILHFDTGKATTLPLILYKLRRIGYIVSLAVGLRRAVKILAVSKTTKQEIIDHFGIDSGKIEVTYEGIDNKLKTQMSKLKTEKRVIKDSYFLYIGNAYPHKNLETLLRAFQQLTVSISSLSKTKLVLVGKDDFFYRKLKERVEELSLSNQVIFFGEANDIQLKNLYTHAVALIFPSLMEGFGLPGLEAMAMGTPVVCSDIPVFHEIYGNAALYFDPRNPEDITTKLNTIISDNTLKNRLIEKGKNRTQAYEWSTMVEKTLRIYNQ
ncbi:glycosyltransferase family 4 protein [Candidatus Gottesmanbacteria bacterium]|nr:glycosyltransferase family 4 protein [Candidatus Gottesmanbacteria bacterium]